MTSKLELYKCKVCTNLIEVVNDGVGTLVCCNEEMNLLQTLMPNETDAHYAHLEILDEMTKKITFNHPMNQEHYIEFIEVISKDEKYVKRKYLCIDEKPEIVFKCECKEGFWVRVYCNIHGVLKTVL